MGRKKLIAITVIGAGLTILLLINGLSRVNNSSASQPFQKSVGVIVVNLTRAFQVVSATRNGDVVRLTFHNGYDRTVNAFTLSGTATSGVQVDLLGSDHEIGPGGNYEYRFFASNLEPSGSPINELTLTIRNVVFEDGTGDGDESATAIIRSRRLGERFALEQIMPMLDEAITNRDHLTPEHLKRLRERIVDRCKSLKQQQPTFARGIEHAQTRVTTDIEQIEATVSDATPYDNLIKLKNRYVKEADKLKKIKRSGQE